MRLFNFKETMHKILRILKYKFLENIGLREKINFKEAFNRQERLLIKATIEQDRKTLSDILDNGMTFDFKGKAGVSPILWFIRHEEWEAVKLAIELGADPDFLANKHSTPLDIFILQNNLSMVDFFLRHGANPNILNQHEQPILFDAILDKNWAILKLLVRYGADVDLLSRAGENSALYAATLFRFEMVFYLIAQGAIYTLTSNSGLSIQSLIEEAIEENIFRADSEGAEWMMRVKRLIEH